MRVACCCCCCWVTSVVSNSVWPHRRHPTRQEHWSGLPFPSPMHEREVAQSCPTLRNPMDCSLPGSSVWLRSYQLGDKIDLKVGGESKGLWGRTDLLTSVQQTHCVCWGCDVTGVTAEQIRVLQAAWGAAACKPCSRVWSLVPGIQEPCGFMEQASLLYQLDRPGSVCSFFY